MYLKITEECSRLHFLALLPAELLPQAKLARVWAVQVGEDFSGTALLGLTLCRVSSFRERTLEFGSCGRQGRAHRGEVLRPRGSLGLLLHSDLTSLQPIRISVSFKIACLPPSLRCTGYTAQLLKTEINDRF